MHIPLLRILGPSLVVTLIRHLEVGDQVTMEVVVVGKVRDRWVLENGQLSAMQETRAVFGLDRPKDPLTAGSGRGRRKCVY